MALGGREKLGFVLEMNATEYVKQRLQDQIDWHEAKSGWNQRWFKRLQLVVIAAGALLPLLAGLQAAEVPGMSYAVGALGVVVAIVTGTLGLYRFQELWIDYRLTAEALNQEKYRFVTGSPPYDVAESLPILVERVEAILAEQNSQWQQVAQAAAAEAEAPSPAAPEGPPAAG